MLFIQAFVAGFAVTIGIEVALGLRYAVKAVMKGKKK